MPFTDKVGHLIKALQKEKHYTAGQFLKGFVIRNCHKGHYKIK